MTTLVVGLLSAAAWVAVGPAPAGALDRLTAPLASRARTRSRLVLAAGCATWLTLIAVVFGARWLGWAVAAFVAGGTLWWVLRSSLLAARRRHREDETASAATTLSLLLRSGHLPGEALAETAVDSPGLAPAAAAAAVGGDVGAALDRLADEPGRRGLARVAAAWRVSLRTGAPVAGLLAQVAASLRRDREVGDLVEAELSSARASSRIMAALPFVAIGLGTVVGADPVGFLFGSPVGEVLFVAGMCLAALGVLWTDRLATSAAHGTKR